MKKVMVVYGTRPEAVKVAPLIKELEKNSELAPVTVVTGQHREMLDQVNSVFGISPDIDLDLFKHGQGLNELTSRIFSSLEGVYSKVDPDAVVVQGDTTSVMAAAVAAFYKEIPVVHLEAGLRSHNLFSPFPEEANRKIVSQIASLHLAPTAVSKSNLLREGIDEESVITTGNTVIDALLYTVGQTVEWSDSSLDEVSQHGGRTILVTAHRRENWGNAMVGVGRALSRIARKFPDDQIVLPAHRNPVVREAILPQLQGLSNVVTMEPLAYGEFAHLLSKSHLVITDSGGIQEEAPTLGKPVLVLRENTERPEAVDAGTVKLVGTKEEDVFDEASTLLSDPDKYALMAQAVNPYGDGLASSRSAAGIASLLGVGSRVEDFSPIQSSNS